MIKIILLTIAFCWFVARMDEPNRRGACCRVGQYNVCYKQCWLVNQWCYIFYNGIISC